MLDVNIARRLAGRDTLHLGHIERLLAQVQAERLSWFDRSEAMPLRPPPPPRPDGAEERLRTALDRMHSARMTSRHRPWWRRWF